jgi:hypothetical protein
VRFTPSKEFQRFKNNHLKYTEIYFVVIAPIIFCQPFFSACQSRKLLYNRRHQKFIIGCAEFIFSKEQRNILKEQRN